MKARIEKGLAQWHGHVSSLRDQSGKAGWILLWALGVPVPVLLVLFLLRGCT